MLISKTMVKTMLAGLLFAATMVHLATAAAGMNPVAERWRSSSRWTPSEAAHVLYLEAVGEAVPAEDLFEAEKHLRSDGPVSPNEYVLTEIFTQLLRQDLDGSSSGLRVVRPLLHWLESRASPTGVEISGESLQLAVGHGSAEAVVRLRHVTRHHRWEDCGGALCLSTLREPIRSEVSYLWSADSSTTLGRHSLACDPSPSGATSIRAGSRPTFRHIARQLASDETLEVSCRFFAPHDASLRITYAAGDSIAFAPARAAASAVVNNPLELRLFE